MSFEETERTPESCKCPATTSESRRDDESFCSSIEERDGTGCFLLRCRETPFHLQGVVITLLDNKSPDDKHCSIDEMEHADGSSAAKRADSSQKFWNCIGGRKHQRRHSRKGEDPKETHPTSLLMSRPHRSANHDIADTFTDDVAIDCSRSENNADSKSKEGRYYAQQRRLNPAAVDALARYLKKRRFCRQRTKLCLEGMQLHRCEIPTEMFRPSTASTLESLSLSGNDVLETIPTGIVTGLPLLKSLDLSRCGLLTLPQKWNMPKLITLDLGHNRLHDFPSTDVFKGVPNLERLILYGNLISHFQISSETKAFSSIILLDIGYNDLIRLDPTLCKLTSLKTLNACNNFISFIPPQIAEMNNLKCFDLTSNPCIEPPMEVCGQGLRAIRRYWRHQQQRLPQREEGRENDPMVL